MGQRLIIIRGIPGSGKSTYAKKIKHDLFESGNSVTHFEADMFFMKDGKYNWNQKLAPIAHKWCYNSVFKSFDNGTNVVIVSNTFVKLGDMNNYIKEAESRNIDVTVYRMENRFKSVHEVPEETLNKMSESFQDYDNETIVKEGQ